MPADIKNQLDLLFFPLMLRNNEIIEFHTNVL